MQPAVERAEAVSVRGGRTWIPMVLYAVLLVAALATLNDWRIRVVTVAIVLLFAGKTLWSPRRPAPKPWGRAADQDGGGDGNEPM